jgi:hypothetical protein
MTGTPMTDLTFALVDEDSFDDIPDPAQPGARCQTCDYWERLDGGREAPEPDAPDAAARASLKRGRLLAGVGLSGAYAMLARETDAVASTVVGYAQFGPLSAYSRAQSIRERYPDLPESPAPWVITCLQLTAHGADADTRLERGRALLEAVCDELDRRGITAVEAYPEVVADAWLPSPGPIEAYEAAGFERIAGDEHFPVVRRELSGETDAGAWDDLLRASRRPGDEEGWPLPLPATPDADDFFKLPPDRPKRPNPFGDD